MRRRIAAILATTAVLAITTAAPAGAQDPQRLGGYDAGSTATALELTLLGQTLGVSHTTAGVSSPEAQATANGAALLLAGTPVPGDAPAAAPGGPETNEACAADIDLGEESGGALSLLAVSLACVETAAALPDGAPHAQSTTGELTITLTTPGGAVLEPILAPLFDAIPQATTPLFDALAPILDGLEEQTDIALRQVLDDLLADLQDPTVVLAEIVLAPSVSQAGATQADGVVARAGANGVTIHILPGIASTLIDLGLDVPAVSTPLLTVQLGQAVAEVIRHPETGAVQADASAAQLLSIEGAEELGILSEIFGQLTGAVNNLAIEQLGCTDANPLAPALCIDLGTVRELDAEAAAARGFDFGAGTVGREATAAGIQVLPVLAEQLGGPALGLSFAEATAVANAEVAAPRGPEGPAAPPQGSLPKTGADTSLPVTLGLLAAAAAGLGIVRRTRTS